MTMDKSWTKITNKVDPTFIKGALDFAKRAETYADSEGRIYCPCKNCANARRYIPRVVGSHIIHNGFEPSYNVWIYHGEHLPGYETDGTNSECEESENESNDGVNELLDDAFPTGGETEAENFTDGANQCNNPHVEKLFADMEKPLYPGCDEFSVLGFLLELMNVKVTCNMTNVSMDMILNLFSRAYKDANLPKNHYEAKKYLRTLGLGYESIHACKHDYYVTNLKQVREMYKLNPSQVNEELYALSCLPDNRVSSYRGFIVNGVKYIVKARDDCRQTQNCGVTVPGVHDDVEDDYYGYLDEVIELSFIKGYRIVLFKCTWFDTYRRRKHVIFDPHFISIDTSQSAYKEDPFIFANQAKQVFYIDDSRKPNSEWKIIERIAHRHLWDIPEHNNSEDLLENVNLLREDIAEEIVENVVLQGSDSTLDDFIDDEIDDSDHIMEDFASELNLDDSDTDKSNNEIEYAESDDDDDDL